MTWDDFKDEVDRQIELQTVYEDEVEVVDIAVDDYNDKVTLTDIRVSVEGGGLHVWVSLDPTRP